MSEQRPTREQWLAVNLLQQDIAVTAGAGSGKTWVLTRRYLTQLAGRQIVPDPLLTEADPALPEIIFPEAVAPDQIIAITFTEKAAKEMKERIRMEMQRLYLESDEHARETWQSYMDEVESAMITTIHGLCARLIRQYPLQADINPNFSVLEPYEADALFEQAVEQVITVGLEQQDDFVLELLREYPMYSFRKGIREIFDQLRELHDPSAWHDLAVGIEQKAAANQKLAIAQAAHLVSLGDAVEMARPQIAKSVFEGKMAEGFHPYWSLWRQELLDNDGVWTNSLQEMVQTITEASKGTIPKSYKEVMPPFRTALQEWARQMCSPHYKALCTYVLQFVIEVERSYQILKRKQHLLDFTDMQIAAVRLMQNEQIRNKITRNLRYVMVDEFQDTNHMQAQLVRYLAEHAKLFIVGDAKQSIYGFRQADVGVFIELQKDIQTKRSGQWIEMRHNFRTVEPIIDFINRLFSTLMAPQAMKTQAAGASYQVAYDAGMLATRKPPVAQQQGDHEQSVSQEQPFVELIHLPLDSSDAETQEAATQTISEAKQSRLQEAELIAQRICALVANEKRIVEKDPLTGQPTARKVQYGDITMLFSSMKNVSLFEFMLQKYEIPYYVVGSRNFYQRQEIMDVLHVLRLLIDPQDQLALVGALRSPIFAVSDEGLFWLSRMHNGLQQPIDRLREKELPVHVSAADREHLSRAIDLLKQWKGISKYAQVSEIVESIVTDSGIRQILITQFGGTQKIGNLDKLIEISRNFQNGEGGNLFAFVQFLNAMVDNQEDEADADVTSLDEDVVKIMTIHQSKGLEFPIVVVPDMARQFRPDTFQFAYHREMGLGVKLAKSKCTVGSDEKTVLLDGSGTAQELQIEKSDRAQHEERRKLYVALTRARDYLILVASKKPQKKQKRTTDADDECAISGKNWFAWLIAIFANGDLEQISAACESYGVRYVSPELVMNLYTSCRMPQAQNQVQVEGNESNMNFLDIPLQMPLSTIHKTILHNKSYQTASMLMLEQEDFEKYVRVYHLGLPDWQEWNQKRHTPFQAVTVEDEVENTSLSADQLGSIVHRICERLTVADQAEMVTKQVLIEFGQFVQKSDTIYLQVWDLVERYVKSDIFQEVCAAAEVYSEVPFRVQIEGRVVSGVIDKLIIDEKGVITVLDFKTNKVTEANRQQLIEQYQTQMKLYQQAVEAIYHKPVQTKLVFVRDLPRKGLFTV